METTTTENTYRTRQEIFDIAYRGLAAQGFKRSLMGAEDAGMCAYRGVDGCKCAIGFLIDDADYSAQLEHQTAYRAEVLAAAKIRSADDEFARRLQMAHDGGNLPATMKRRLREFADLAGLTIPQLDNAEAAA